MLSAPGPNKAKRAAKPAAHLVSVALVASQTLLGASELAKLAAVMVALEGVPVEAVTAAMTAIKSKQEDSNGVFHKIPKGYFEKRQ